MHVLDLIMYFVLMSLIRGILYVISDGEFTEELGGALVMLPIIVIYTIIYIAFFVIGDYNWSEIFPYLIDCLKW